MDEVIPTYPLCWEETTGLLGGRLACQRPLDHEGDHGNGPFIEYSTMWPTESEPWKRLPDHSLPHSGLADDPLPPAQPTESEGS